MIQEQKLVFGFALALAVVGAGLGGCASDVDGEEPEPAESVASELSRCGRRPITAAGCTARCVCSGAVTGPYGETREDYICTPVGGGFGRGERTECRLQVPRRDCSWDINC